MLFTNKDILLHVLSLSACSEKGKLGYAIARNTRKHKEAGKEYLDMYDEWVKAHQSEYKDVNKMLEDAFAHLAELSDIQHDVDVYQVDPETFYSGELTNRQMEALSWICNDDEPADEPEKG